MLKAKSLVKFIVALLLILVLGGANFSCALVKIGPEGQITVDASLESDSQPPTIDFFNASPSSITSGDISTIEWSVSGATEVSINQGIGSAIPAGSVAVSPASTTTYNLTATNSAGSATQSVTIAVTTPSPPTLPPPTLPPPTLPPPASPPPASPPSTSPVIISFTATPSSISSGGSSILSWSVTGVTSVSISPGGGSLPPSGSATTSPAATTTYTLTATNAADTVTRQAIVTVGAAPPASPVVVSFTANPASISPGGNSLLSWNVTGVTSVTIAPGVGSRPPSGTTTVSPAATTTYTLTATNAADTVTRQAIVTVGAAPLSGDVATCESALFDAVNAVRAANGRPALTRNAYIDGLCRDHAEYMASAGTLSHDGFISTRFPAIAATIPGIHTGAENALQNNTPCDATAMAQQWFDSPLHNANMLNSAYTISGMGIAIDGSGRIWACQIFAGP